MCLLGLPFSNQNSGGFQAIVIQAEQINRKARSKTQAQPQP